MNIFVPTVILALFTLGIFFLMWRTWQGRRHPDSGYLQEVTLSGAEIATLPRVQYVSTVKSQSALERVQIEGLRYRGYAQIVIRADGVEITVTGENTVHIAKDLILDAGTAQMRLGKVVEREGLAALVWKIQGESVDTSFRFNDPTDQRVFLDAVLEMLGKVKENS